MVCFKKNFFQPWKSVFVNACYQKRSQKFYTEEIIDIIVFTKSSRSTSFLMTNSILLVGKELQSTS